jgi:hypothetical protein
VVSHYLVNNFIIFNTQYRPAGPVGLPKSRALVPPTKHAIDAGKNDKRANIQQVLARRLGASNKKVRHL